MENCVKNEKKYCRIQVTAEDGSVVTVSTYSFQVFDKDGNSVQGSATASISGNGTAAVEIYGLVDTTAAGFTAGSWYYVRFAYVIGAETYIKDDWFTVT